MTRLSSSRATTPTVFIGLMKACTRSLENRFFWTLSATTPKPVSSTASRARASACGRTAAAMPIDDGVDLGLREFAEQRLRGFGAACERPRLGNRREIAVGGWAWAQSRRPWKWAAHAQTAHARIEADCTILPKGRQRRYHAVRPHVAGDLATSAAIFHTMTRLTITRSCLRSCAGGAARRCGRGEDAGPAGGDAVGDASRVRAPRSAARRGHLQVPGRRQRAGLRSGLPGLRPLPRRRRGAAVDRRPRSGRADEPVEARQVVQYTRTVFIPVVPVHRRRAGPHRPVLAARPAALPLAGEDCRPAVVQGRDAAAAAALGERVPAFQGRLASGRGRARQHDRRVAMVEEGRRRCRSGIRRRTVIFYLHADNPAAYAGAADRRRSRSTACRSTPSR